jgi:Zn-dependent protease with chaperone function
VTYLCLGASLALAAFLATDVVASLIVTALWWAARGDLDRVSARARAGGLFLLRVFPAAAAATVVVGVFLPAFWKFEPRDSSEMVGQTLVAIAVVSAGMILAGLRRGWQASRATRRVLREWLHHARALALPGLRIRAYAIQTEFPVVSLVGIFRPRLFVSERVLHACTPEELAAMVRHECGHLASRDNLKRLALRVCPNPLPLRRVGRDLERRWQEACEEAADDYAARASAPSALVLANALLRVARMAPPRHAPNAALTALYSGDSIERRVKRLIASGPLGGSRATWLVVARALAVVPPALAATVLLNADLLRTVHHVIEVVVETLP